MAGMREKDEKKERGIEFFEAEPPLIWIVRGLPYL